MSSLFFARRCRQLVLIESDPAWYGQMQELFARRGIANVDYRFRDLGGYTALPDLADHSFDLVVVDGLVRDQAAMVALQKVVPGEGYVFFDNSDVPWAEHRAARLALTAAAEPGGVCVFNDLYPFQLQVNESILVKVRGSQEAEPGAAADRGRM